MLGVQRRKDLSRRATTPQENAQVFQNMLRDADELYPGVERLFARKRIDDIPCPGRKRHVWLNANGGTKFELTQKNLVPFGPQDTERAMWNSICRVDSSNLQHIVDANAQVYVTVQHREEKEDVMMTSFVASVPAIKRLSGVQIWKVVRRYVKADGTVFICRTLTASTFAGNGPAIRTNATAQLVVKHDQEVSLILSHVTVSNQVLGDELSTPTIEVDSAIAIWDGVLSRIASDVESFLLDESLQKSQSQALGEG
ncbi:hypothetical protein BBJ28_00026160 [Nothophytophthora sp. Chile5]|nr:hypothetical protein BBJ28_00026160 [Nothophytophthora sp. Chile5]